MTTIHNEDPADPSPHEPRVTDAYRCIAPACKPLGCSMCNCAVPADVYAALLTPLHGEIERLRDVAREAADAATKHQAEVLRLRAENAALKRDLEYARGGLTKGRTRMREDNERLREALRKLVEVEDMRLRLRQLHEMGHGTDYADCNRLLPLAWAEAREALGPNVGIDRTP